MAQIAYADRSRSVAHVVVTVGVGVTLCGKGAISYGEMLPFNRELWPDLAWCEQCVRAYDGDQMA